MTPAQFCELVRADSARLGLAADGPGWARLLDNLAALDLATGSFEDALRQRADEDGDDGRAARRLLELWHSDEVRARVYLRCVLGADADFREGQWEAIRALVQDRARLLVVQRTGWGKSLVYFIATRLLRDRGAGPTLLISPLLSLMRNQVAMAERIGVEALSINSANQDNWEPIERALAEDRCDVLLVSPERLGNERFRRQTLPSMPLGVGLLVVDEAHCISDWGHDFRPDYRRIVRAVRELPRAVPVLATTATANDRVVADVAQQLGEGLRLLRGPLARRSLRLQTIRLANQAERLAWLAERLPDLPGAGIIYCLTVRDCERVAAWLRGRGINAVAYHADLESPVREVLEQQLLRNEVKALVATVALGMGFDKPDLGFVVHFQRPGSLVAYYQQVGRAGRAVETAYAILLNGREDDEIQDYFIRTAFPDAPAISGVLAAIEQSDRGLTITQIEPLVNLPRGRIERCLKVLEVDGAVVREGGRWIRTPNVWEPDEERSRQVTLLRRSELDRIRTFVESETCLMEFVARELNDPHAHPCGQCAVCAGPLLPSTVGPHLVREAVEFLRQDVLSVAPRAQWPSQAIPGRSGRIPPDLRNAEGRVLAVYGDAGWGYLVRQGKYLDGRFADELVEAAARVVRAWAPDPSPVWVTSVPSLRNAHLVPDFARRLADALGLPYRDALRKVVDTPPQKAMQNSAQQAANVAGAFEALGAETLPDPVLLVDDMVDSGWTFTMCGVLLREAGSGVVYPLALARATGGGDGP